MEEHQQKHQTEQDHQEPQEQEPQEQEPQDQEPQDQEHQDQEPQDQEPQDSLSLENVQNNIEHEFSTVVQQLINEVDLLFDYIGEDKKRSLRKYAKQVEKSSEFRKAEIKAVYEQLKPYESNLYQTCYVNKKVRTAQLGFLDNIVLFNGTLNFDMFKNENKNTKITLTNYINSIYMACSFSKFGASGDFSVDGFRKELDAFMSQLQARTERAKDIEQPVASSSKKKRHVHRRQKKNGIDDIFGSLMANPQILNMAADITKDLENEQLDPMALLGSLMSGKPDAKLNNLVSNLTNKLEQKISSGEINKDELENQAKNIMNAVQDSDIAEQMPMLKNLLNKKNQFRK